MIITLLLDPMPRKIAILHELGNFTLERVNVKDFLATMLSPIHNFLSKGSSINDVQGFYHDRT